jgi:hypothetical protein
MTGYDPGANSQGLQPRVIAWMYRVGDCLGSGSSNRPKFLSDLPFIAISCLEKLVEPQVASTEKDLAT